MRRIAVLTAAAAAVLAGVGVTSAARAAATPTITGPATVPYFALVHLTGTTPAPDQAVAIYERRSGDSSYTVQRRLTSNDAGTFGLTFRATGDRSVYARVAGVNSAVHVTRLVRATCTVSHPLFRHLPLRTPGTAAADAGYAALTATNGVVWGGVNVDPAGGRFAVLRWKPGAPPTVLARYTYRGVGYWPRNPGGSVDVVGVSPTGAVVAAVQRTTANADATKERFVGRVWIGRRVHALAGPTNWITVHPTGLAADGSIYGYANAHNDKHPDFKVVRWARDGSHPRVLADTGDQLPFAVVDGAGDVSYSKRGGDQVVRLVSGKVVLLPGLGDLPFYGGPGHLFYGYTDDGQARWDVGTDGSAIRMTLLAPRPGNHWLRAVGAGGSIVDGYATNRGSRIHLRTARGAWVRVPRPMGVVMGTWVILGLHAATPAAVRAPALRSPALRAPAGEQPLAKATVGFALTPHGALAFTSATDGLVHVLRCH